MALPTDLVLVRHGESVGNAAKEAERNGDVSPFTEKYVTTPGRLWRLTPRGVAQAQCTGAWLNEENRRGAFGVFGRVPQQHYVSPLVRTRETAGNLGLTFPKRSVDASVEWRLNRSIRERDWGDIETILTSEFREQYKLSHMRQQTDPLYWRPPGGESIADVADLRVRNFLDTLHRECSDKTVVGVTHGEYMRAMHMVLTRANDETYSDWKITKELKIRNCEVIHYTRHVPEEFSDSFSYSGSKERRIAFFRRARPVPTDAGGWVMEVDGWKRIEFQTYTNETLLQF